MGSFAAIFVLKTRTAFAVGEVVVAGIEVVVTSGEGVVSLQE